MRQFFCQVNVWIEARDDLGQWLAAFADDGEFLRQALFVNFLDHVDSPQTRAALADFCGQYPGNTAVYAVADQSYAACYNAFASDGGEFQYVNFTNTDVLLKVSDLRRMKERTKQREDIKLWSFYPISIQPDGSHKPYLPWPAANYHHSNSRFDRFSLYLPGYLIRRGLGAGFDEEAPEDGDILFLLGAIFDGKDYMLTDLPLHTRASFETDYYNYPRQFDPAWYTETLLQVYVPFLKKHPKSPFVKAMVMHQIALRFACNRNDRGNGLLLGQELTEFFRAVSRTLGLIDDSILVTYNRGGWKLLPKHMGLVFLRIKYKDPQLMPTITCDGTGNYAAVYKTALLDTKSTLKAAITCMDYDRRAKELVIDGRVTNAHIFDYSKIRCCCLTGTARIPAKRTEIYSLDKYFGVSVCKDFTFQLCLSREVLQQGKQLSFRFQYKDLTVELPLSFPRMQSRLTERFPHSYWNFSSFMMTLDPKKRCLRLSPRKKGRILGQELLLYRDFFRNSPKTEWRRAAKSVFLRLSYWLTRPLFRKKQVWLTFDQLFKGGDNGEYFFRYVADHHTGEVDMYYVANRDCPDFRRLRARYSKVLPFNSLKEKLVALHANCVFATRVDVKQYCGFGPQLEPYFRGLLGYEVFCLQHGLTIQRIAQYQNRLFDNTKLYFCVCPNEIENLRHPVYGYDPEVLVLTGAARYDGLVNDDRRQILIAPTWRRNLTAGTNRKGHNHDYSAHFKQSEYYRVYNSLLHNERLLACARDTGYRIVYLLHPILSPQIGDFQVPEEVTILCGSGESYEKLLCQSSLMLTDHSGIQFDFAYLRKPLVYYHPDTLPPQYDAGGMDYETQAFGPVCRCEKEVVEALCQAMERQCQMQPQYLARADAFFPFGDRGNCQRIFEAAAKYQGLRRQGE